MTANTKVGPKLSSGNLIVVGRRFIPFQYGWSKNSTDAYSGFV